MTKSQQYISDILSGKVNHGKWIKLLCEKHQRELKDKNCPFIFDSEDAELYVNFIESLVFVEGKWAGKPFVLENWQAFFVSMIFGWKTKATGLRRFRQATLNVPKKNGKTALAAAIAIACAYLDNEEMGQIYMAATAQAQSAICFKAAKAIIKKTPDLSKRFNSLAHHLVCKRNNTFIKYISSEAGGIEGAGASVVIFDEEHLQITDELRDNLFSGQASRQEPLFISISTAGSNKNVPYFAHLSTCKKILEGIIEDDSHLVLIYAAPESEKKSTDVDWENPDVWKIANPNWGVSVLEQNFLVDYKIAKNDAAKQPNFITKKLNIWADSDSTWIDSKVWAALKTDKKLSDFTGADVYLGLDLGVTGDFSALAILIHQDGKFYLFMRFWIPAEMAETRTNKDKINFKEWARQGYLTLTDGNATDYTKIENDILEISEKFNVVSLSYDKAFASMLITRLSNDYSINCAPFSQGIGNVTGPTKQFHEMILSQTIEHDGNPVMAWMMSNVQIYNDDANGNYKIHKGRSTNKVDGPCAVVNAIGVYLIDYANNYGNDNFYVV